MTAAIELVLNRQYRSGPPVGKRRKRSRLCATKQKKKKFYYLHVEFKDGTRDWCLETDAIKHGWLTTATHYKVKSVSSRMKLNGMTSPTVRKVIFCGYPDYEFVPETFFT